MAMACIFCAGKNDDCFVRMASVVDVYSRYTNAEKAESESVKAMIKVTCTLGIFTNCPQKALDFLWVDID